MIALVLALTAAWTPPVQVKTLPNGLTVVVSEDHSSPTFGLCVSYRIGHRLEPRGRSGFAHLFEHLMFEGTPQAKKGTMDRVIESGGGSFNATTHADDTTYVATAPIGALDAALWLEADRMRALDFSEETLANQREVVKDEIRENVQNQPYGDFYWSGLYALAYDKWANKHDGYGSFADLDAARVADVERFFQRYYGPNNAVIAIVGDVRADDVLARVEKYFGALPARPVPPRPDVSEGLGTAPRTIVQKDKLARVPALAVGWRMPPRGSADQVPLALLSQVLVGGEASRLYLGLVRGRRLLSRVEGGVGWPERGAFDGDGPTLFTVHGLYKTDAKAALAAIEEEIARVAKDGVSDEELARNKAGLRAELYSELEPFVDRAEGLAVAQQLWGDARHLLTLADAIDRVTSADLERVARKYLVAQNRVMIDRRVLR